MWGGSADPCQLRQRVPAFNSQTVRRLSIRDSAERSIARFISWDSGGNQDLWASTVLQPTAAARHRSDSKVIADGNASVIPGQDRTQCGKTLRAVRRVAGGIVSDNRNMAVVRTATPAELGRVSVNRALGSGLTLAIPVGSPGRMSRPTNRNRNAHFNRTIRRRITTRLLRARPFVAAAITHAQAGVEAVTKAGRTGAEDPMAAVEVDTTAGKQNLI